MRKDDDLAILFAIVIDGRMPDFLLDDPTQFGELGIALRVYSLRIIGETGKLLFVFP